VVGMDVIRGWGGGRCWAGIGCVGRAGGLVGWREIVGRGSGPAVTLELAHRNGRVGHGIETDDAEG